MGKTNHIHFLRIFSLFTMSLCLATCASPSKDSEKTNIYDPEKKVLQLNTSPHCNNLNPLSCILPWPSMRYLTPDKDRETGFRLDYDPKGFQKSKRGKELDTSPLTRLDGFSPNSQILTIFEEPIETSELAGQDSIERSLEDNSPTLLIDLNTGTRIAHWVENDARAESSNETIFYIHPAAPLTFNHSYGIALRNLKGQSGKKLSSSKSFQALRDRLPTSSTQIEARRDEFEQLFSHLKEYGIDRTNLQSAWQFKTSSIQSNHKVMLAMREDALRRLGANGIQCNVLDNEPNYKDTGATLLSGSITTPLYMTAERFPAEIARDDNGMPVFQRNVDIKFTAIFPKSLLQTPQKVPLITLGHGLFGNAEKTLKNKNIINVAEKFNVVIVATDWAGMSQKDLAFLSEALADPSKFYMLGEMLRQAMINQIALTRTVLGQCRKRKEFKIEKQEIIDEKQSFYIGVSQGSILGGTLMTLSPDIDKGALLVGGSHFSFMIERSIHFEKFELFLKPSFPKRIDRALLMAVSQHIWDRAESGTYLPFTVKGGLGDLKPKQILYIVAENDSQVPNLSSDLGARLAGIPVLSASVRKPWGIPEVASSHQGSAYVSFHYGDPNNPDGNISPSSDFGGHWNVPLHDTVGKSIWHFFQRGEAKTFCQNSCDLRNQ